MKQQPMSANSLSDFIKVRNGAIEAELSVFIYENDGFKIAAEDLRLRGPGDLFGLRQSGIMEFRLADIFNDMELLTKAGEAASSVLTKDPDLSSEENRRLKEHVEAYIRAGSGGVIL